MGDNFIKTYDVFDEEWCDNVIKRFEENDSIGATHRRHDEIRRDHQLEMNSALKTENTSMDLRNTEIASEFFDKLRGCIADYYDEFNLSQVLGSSYFKNALVQRSRADDFESYSTWHCEAGTTESEDRVLTYLLYLNDDFEGGETEFMFQKHREKPKKGTLVLFPSYFTHVHRGGMIMSGTKYIITGWTFNVPDLKLGAL